MQELRRGHTARAQDDLGTGVRLHHFAAVPHLHAGAAHGALGAGRRYQQAGHLRTGPEFKIGSPIAGRSQKRLGGIPAPALLLVDLEIAYAVVIPGVEIGAGRNARLHCGLGKGLQHIPAQPLFVHPPFATGLALLEELVVRAMRLSQRIRDGCPGSVYG